jgi:hypothetical protein
MKTKVPSVYVMTLALATLIISQLVASPVFAEKCGNAHGNCQYLPSGGKDTSGGKGGK